MAWMILIAIGVVLVAIAVCRFYVAVFRDYERIEWGINHDDKNDK